MGAAEDVAPGAVRQGSRGVALGAGYPRSVASAPVELPLFPLSQVVLFPRVRAPLHIFEPRYRQLMQAALAGARTIGMATVLPEQQEQMAGDPPLYEVGCAGFIEAWERLADGRYNLVLHGTQRFRVLREPPRPGERLYRVAEVELLADEPARAQDDGEIAAGRERVLALLRQLLERSASPGDTSRLAALDHETFANTLCQILGLPAEEKQGLLEAPGARARLDALEGLLHFHLVKQRMPAGSGSEVLH
jgi:Lon protease-like protein